LHISYYEIPINVYFYINHTIRVLFWYTHIQNPFSICNPLFYKTRGIVYIMKLFIVRGQSWCVSSHSNSDYNQEDEQNKQNQINYKISIMMTLSTLPSGPYIPSITHSLSLFPPSCITTSFISQIPRHIFFWWLLALILVLSFLWNYGSVWSSWWDLSNIHLEPIYLPLLVSLYLIY